MSLNAARSIQSKWTPFSNSVHLPFKDSQTVDLYCFPFAGGSASVFMPWIMQAQDILRVKPIELPGRGTRLAEAAHTNISDLIDVMMQEIAIDPSRPFAVFGYSMGGMIAYEWVRRIEEMNGPRPLHLFISASGGRPDNEKHRFRGSFNDADLLLELQRMGGTAEEVLRDAEMMKLLLPFIRADFQLVDSFYKNEGVKLDTPITVYGGEDDAEISDSCYQSWLNSSRNPNRVTKFAGGHFFIKDNYEKMLLNINNSMF